MKWEDLKDSTEFAEALSLAASLVAAMIALKDAQNKQKEEEDSADAGQNDDLASKPVDLVPSDALVGLVHDTDKVGIKRYVPSVVVGLSVVVTIQMLILLFIAHKLL